MWNCQRCLDIYNFIHVLITTLVAIYIILHNTKEVITVKLKYPLIYKTLEKGLVSEGGKRMLVMYKRIDVRYKSEDL